MRLLVVFACGCNAILGLHDDYTRRPPSDAQVFDTPADAPFTCPPLGTAPAFRPAVHPLPIVDCFDYSFSQSAGLAIANCTTTPGAIFGTVGEGAIDSAVSLAATVDDPSTYEYFQPRLAADGDELIRLRYSQYPTFRFTFEVLHHDAPLTWSPASALPYDKPESQVPSLPDVSTISRGPDRRVIVIDRSTTDTSPQLHEFASSGTGWQLTDTYSINAVDAVVTQPALSSDGLRMVFVGSGGVRYTDRASVGVRFGASQLVKGVPSTGVTWPMLDDNCGKLYFSALDTVFFLEQGP
jgi:hypothetical protein